MVCQALSGQLNRPIPYIVNLEYCNSGAGAIREAGKSEQHTNALHYVLINGWISIRWNHD